MPDFAAGIVSIGAYSWLTAGLLSAWWWRFGEASGSWIAILVGVSTGLGTAVYWLVFRCAAYC